MQFDIVTLFPNIFDSYFGESIVGRSLKKGLVRIRAHNIREFGEGRHKNVDDRPYGGGAGMVLMARPILKTVRKILRARKTPSVKRNVIILSAKGEQLTQKHASQWAKKYTHIILVSGRYEGIDERVRQILKAEEISMGPYVLTDGDVAAMAVVSAVTRLLPGAIRLESLHEESHWNQVIKKEGTGVGLQTVEYSHYTRPEVFEWPERGKRRKKYPVPKILLSGDHKKIAAWRKGS